MAAYDYIIIGGGITGLSVGYQLSKHSSVLLLEQESHPGYHATGRSAAVFSPFHGCDRPALFSLSNASSDFFHQPPQGFCEHPLLKHRGVLMIAEKDKQAQLKATYNKLLTLVPDLKFINQESVKEKLPALCDEYNQNAIYDDNVYDVDVHALQEGYLKSMRKQGAVIKTNQRVSQVTQKDNLWTVSAVSSTNEQESFQTQVVINAAGAWADGIAEMAGLTPVGIQPLRRSAMLIDTPEPKNATQTYQSDEWPMVVEFEENFYIKPDAGCLLISAADETLSPPCDAQPDELEVAYAAHYAEQAFGIPIRKVNHSWAGLRTFVEDRSPVIGYSDEKKGFFWLAGVGGYGIQTSPATGRYAAALVMDQDVPKDISDLGMDKTFTSPARCHYGVNKGD
tara:strand:+ start:14913 stop:16097 length:1185 start_codon:yes stop_codon:yes gene_type:complete